MTTDTHSSGGVITPHPEYPPSLGAIYRGDNTCTFRVWAPRARQVEVRILGNRERLLAMTPLPRGYHSVTVDDVEPGTRYFFRLDGKRDYPDPASRFQPDGVHQASAVVDTRFDWHDQAWRGLPWQDYVIYELHVGTFTPAGTFESAIEQLDNLAELGITAIELMPVAQFPGGRNWGYDGVHPFAVQNTYGGPHGLQQLVDACHQRGLAVIMDVVYNHLGPEGNYLSKFGHYFTPRCQTPWGEAINFDDRYSDEVRRFFIENALYWIDAFHIDALRLDAVHAIFDLSARTFLEELGHAVRQEGQRTQRRVFTIAESSLNDSRLITTVEAGGIGMEAQWNDDLHHSLRVLFGEPQLGYFADFHGFDDLVKALSEGFVLDGRYSVYRQRRHGNSAREIPPERLVVFSQNHDQVGNRPLGERLTTLVNFEQLKLAAGLVLLSPFQPMLFMGEEYAEPAPFQYFVSHQEPALVEAVRRGRREEFADFLGDLHPPDPQDEATFARCKLDHSLRQREPHRTMWYYYQALIRLRHEHSALRFADQRRTHVHVLQPGSAIALQRCSATAEVFVICHFGDVPASLVVPLSGGTWNTRLDSSQPQWRGPGGGPPPTLNSTAQATVAMAPYSIVVLEKSH